MEDRSGRIDLQFLVSYLGAGDLFDVKKQLCGAKQKDILELFKLLSHKQKDDLFELMLVGAAGLQRLNASHSYNKISGLPNKDMMDEALNKAIYTLQREKFAGRDDMRVAFAMIDLDGLKTFNDKLSHAAGDEAIRAFGEFLQHAARQDEHVAHLYGDEFAVLLTDREDNPDFAMKAQARFEKALSKAKLEWRGKTYPLSSSFGFVPVSAASDFETVYERADRLMQQIKQAKGAQRYQDLPKPIRDVEIMHSMKLSGLTKREDVTGRA